MPSPGVCFVCGNIGAQTTLSTRHKDKGPYFPFLEHHDPPSGTRPPGADGKVDSCRVCYAFLTQQWDTYERTDTPAIKRLYWLKRSDDGQFTGAEMRLQGEYVAQVMGLQYQSETGYPSPGGESYNMPQTHFNEGASLESTSYAFPNNRQSFNYSQSEEAVLDLSLHSKSAMKSAATPKVTGSDKDITETFICFTCTHKHPLTSAKYVYSWRQNDKDPFFPFLEKSLTPKHATPLSNKGSVRVCGTCKKTLYQQWKTYEMMHTPHDNRRYKVSREDRASENKGKALTPSKLSAEYDGACDRQKGNICYICGQAYSKGTNKVLLTMPPDMAMCNIPHFPFVRDLRRPSGARPLNPDGTVLTCLTCYSYLHHQWQLFDSQGTHLSHRKYSLPPGVTMPDTEAQSLTVCDQNGLSPRSTKDISQTMSQPLNIRISSTVSSSVPDMPCSSQGLLAIASPNISVKSEISDAMKSHVKAHNIGHHALSTISSSNKVCFICGEPCLSLPTFLMCSYPPRHEVKTNTGQAIPFFPFLANRDPVHGADPMSDDGTVLSCNFCYHILMKQWNAYENPKDAKEGIVNRWYRKYNVKEFVCYICSASINRKICCAISIMMFPFLRDHKTDDNSLLLSNGEHAVACADCTMTLSRQFDEHERLRTPYEMRKYNLLLPSKPDSTTDLELQKSRAPAFEEDRLATSITEMSHASEGLPHGSKPPPLTMLSPAGSAKIQRNTATVPPLNQPSSNGSITAVSGSNALNATRTSSFAAALRKLANQAKDPEEAGSKHGSPPSSNVSPRSSTPKRGPPPLVYSQNSSRASPPVVTIAPTQSYNTVHSSDGRQSIERTQSTHSSASSMYEPVNVKQEKDSRPHSSHSRDDDRASGKDAGSSRRHTPQYTPGRNTPGSASREEMNPRGFQPYRGEDLRNLHPGVYGLDPAYAYHHPAFMPSPFQHPAYRMDDPMLLERYRMVQPSLLAFGASGLMASPGVPQFLPGLPPGGRYPAELLQQPFQYPPSATRMQDPRSASSLSDRSRIEEERQQRETDREREREREREIQARERDLEKDRERQRERQRIEREQLEQLERERERDLQAERLRAERSHGHNREDHRSPSYSEERAQNYGSITQGTPRDPHYADKFRSLSGVVSSTTAHEAALMKTYEEVERWRSGQRSAMALGDDRMHRHLPTKAVLPEQYGKTAEPTSYPRDHRRHQQDKEKDASSRGLPPPLISPISDSGKSAKTPEGSLFRPYDKSLTNGLDNEHNVSMPMKYRTKLFESASEVPPKSQTLTEKELHSKEHAQKTLKQESENVVNHRLHSDKVLTDNERWLPSNLTNHVNPTRAHDKFPSNSYPVKSEQDSVDSNKYSCLQSQGHERLQSRLDFDENRIREARANGTYCSDSDFDDEEELEQRRLDHLMFITTGLPLPLEKSQKKLKYLAILNLTSQDIKRDIQLEQYKKQRKLRRERSISPAFEEKDEQRNNCLRIPSLEDSESLCHESDYKSKSKFFSKISLSANSAEKRKNLHEIRQACDNDRQRLLAKTSACHKSFRRNSSEDSSALLRGVKRKHTHMQVESSSSRSSTHKRSHNSLLQYKSTKDKRAIIFPEAGEKENRLSREFAQEFHQSVLQTTRQKELASRLGMVSSKSDDKPMARGSRESTRQIYLKPRSRHESAKYVQKSSDLHHREHSPTYKWPGISAVLEAYQHHVEEQSLEQQVLHERCKKLEGDNLDLNRSAERLSHRMADLMERKQVLDEERHIKQSAIDNIKQCLKKLK